MDPQIETNRFLVSRRLLISSLASFAATGAARAAPHVLFICKAGTVKSPYAREMTRREAARRGLALSVRSRGLAIEDHVSPQLAGALAADGVNLRREPPQTLAQADIDWADIAVAFDLPLSMRAPRPVLDWTDTPSLNDRYADAKALLATRIRALLDEIAAGCLKAQACR